MTGPRLRPNTQYQRNRKSKTRCSTRLHSLLCVSIFLISGYMPNQMPILPKCNSTLTHSRFRFWLDRDALNPTYPSNSRLGRHVALGHRKHSDSNSEARCTKTTWIDVAGLYDPIRMSDMKGIELIDRAILHNVKPLRLITSERGFGGI
jgi:hypothetical protein